MRKKSLMRLLALSLCAFAATSAVACGGGGNGGFNNGDTSTSTSTSTGTSTSTSTDASVDNGDTSVDTSTSTSTDTSVDNGDTSVDTSTGTSTGGNGGNSGDAGNSNLPKTQLRVYHYNAGYGQDWVYDLKYAFEDLAKNISFETGKMGVEVTISGDMNSRGAEAWRSEPYDVLFLEGPSEFYGMMDRGVLTPLNSIMTTPNPDDNNQTIEEKMTQQQREAYTLNGNYYGIPHYAGHYGLIYNRDMFDEKNFYFAKTPDAAGNFLISDANPEKTLGPDGKTGVIDGIDYSADDGLPTTYEEFFMLCEEINANGIDPICWPGQYTQQHTMLFMDNLVANHEGAEQMNLNYSMEGEANDLIVLDAAGNIVYNEDGTPKTESLEITTENAYELARQEGRYYALKFMETMLWNLDYVNEADSLNDPSRTHIEMQQMFLENGALGYRENAMLMDGVWWQMEANATFNNMTKEYGEQYSKENRRFGWMPLPQATQADADAVASGERKSVFMDYLRAVACLKSNTPSEGVKQAGLAFLKYAYTDEALAQFTYTTGTTIGVEYLDAVDRSQLTPYERTLIDYLEKSEIVYQVSGNKFYAANVNNLVPSKRYSVNGYQGAVEAFYRGYITAEEYFTLHQAGYKGCAW